MNASSPAQTGAPTERAVLPGWIEIVVGLAVFALVAYSSPPLLHTFGLSDVVDGIAVGAVSGVAGLIGFFVAMAVRVRNLAAFGVRRASWKWLLLGLAGGLVAVIVSRLASLAFVLLFGSPENVQQTYQDAAQVGLLAFILSTLFLAILTPIGEEFVFRGVVTTALLRHGAPIGVLGSTVIFALFHGINIALLPAAVVGLVNGELRRRSASVWPGVVAHATNNVVANVLSAVVG